MADDLAGFSGYRTEEAERARSAANQSAACKVRESPETMWEKKALGRIRRMRFIARSHEVGSGARQEPHSHETNAVLVLIQGDLTFVDANLDETAQMRPGDGLFVPVGVVHRVETKARARYVMGLREVVPGDTGITT